MKDFLGDKEIRTKGTFEEDKQTIRETSGKSSFSQIVTANDGSKSQREAKEVYLNELRAAQDAIQRHEIPAGYREYLRKYFEGIQPDDVKAESEEGR